MPLNAILFNLRDLLLRGGKDTGEVSVREARFLATKAAPLFILSRSRDDLRRLERELSRAQTELILKHDLPPRPDLQSEAWMLHAIAKVAGAAADLLPPAASTSQDITKKELILIALSECDSGALDNSELGKRIDATPETVSRSLRDLGLMGLVESWKSGRRRNNRLTPDGIVAAKALLTVADEPSVDMEIVGDTFKSARKIFRVGSSSNAENRESLADTNAY